MQRGQIGPGTRVVHRRGDIAALGAKAQGGGLGDAGGRQVIRIVFMCVSSGIQVEPLRDADIAGTCAQSP